MKFHDFSPFYRSSEGIKAKVSGDRLLDNPLVADVQSGASFKFDGSDDYVIVNDSSQVWHGEDWTYSLWVKTTSNSEQLIELKHDAGANVNNHTGIFMNADGTISCTVYQTAVTSNTITQTNTINDGEWHHLAWSHENTATNGNVFYIDGVAVNSNTSSLTLSATYRRLYIGINRNDTDNSFNSAFDGEIRQVRIHNRALTAAEVRASYNGQAVGFEYVGASQAELVTNGAFAADSDWLKNSNWTITGGEADSNGVVASSNRIYQDVGLESGKSYRYSFDWVRDSGTALVFEHYDGSSFTEVVSISGAGSGTETGVFTVSGATNGLIYFGVTGNWDGQIDNVTCVQIGCVAEYLPTGISATKWINGSGTSGLDGTVTSATAINHEVGSLTMVDDIVMASGKGIDFSATSDATGKTSEVLDDYEEGTWTPVAIGASSNPSAPSTAVGKYTKIGRLVTVDFYVGWPSTGASAGSGNLSISGLPFNSAASGYNAASGVVAYASEWGTGQKGAPSSLYIQADTDDIKVRVADSDIGNKTAYAVSDANAADIQNNTLLAGSMTYRVTD